MKLYNSVKDIGQGRGLIYDSYTRHHTRSSGLHQYSLTQLDLQDYAWVWADFNQPSEEESRLLDTYFHFHPLAIEDCLHAAAPEAGLLR